MIWRKSSYRAETGHCVEVAWRKSSYSAENGECVEVTWRNSTSSADGGQCLEVAGTLGAVRDSKNPGGAVLPVDLGALVRAITSGQL